MQHEVTLGRRVPDLRWLLGCRDGLALCDFGVRLACKNQWVVLDDTREGLEAFVDGQRHGCSRHFTDDLNMEKRHFDKIITEIIRQHNDHTIKRIVYHIMEDQAPDDGTKASDKFLNLRGAIRRLGNVLDHQQAAPANGSRTFLHNTKQQTVTI